MTKPLDQDYIAQLTELAKLDIPIAEIARRLGKTKFQVSGQLHRLKLRSQTTRSLTNARDRARRAAEKEPKLPSKPPPPQKDFTQIKPTKFDWPMPAYTGHLPERPDREGRYLRMSCQYVTAQDEYGASQCGAERHVGHPYCEYHARLCIMAIKSPQATGKPFNVDPTQRF